VTSAVDPSHSAQTRRSFLDLLLGTTLLGTLASILYPILRYLKPLPVAGPGGPMRLTRAETEALDTKRFVIVPAAGTRVLVLRDQEQKLHALDARCTHEGCTVQYVATEGVIWCACHNARFDLDGRVLAGPPPRPLPRYATHEDDEGNVLITPKPT
jgi:cytochrome b6-f complex iron-sulfur subunit